jgi:hypothetical protein
MVKLTVIYTLPENADHEEFLKWRTTEHQESNMAVPGVIKSDFYAIREFYTHRSARRGRAEETGSGDLPVEESPEDHPGEESSGDLPVEESPEDHPGEKQGSGGRLVEEPLRYRYITEAYWPDMESFRSAFFDSGYQQSLMDSLKKIAEPIFLISEEVLSEEK